MNKTAGELVANQKLSNSVPIHCTNTAGQHQKHDDTNLCLLLCHVNGCLNLCIHYFFLQTHLVMQSNLLLLKLLCLFHCCSNVLLALTTVCDKSFTLFTSLLQQWKDNVKSSWRQMFSSSLLCKDCCSSLICGLHAATFELQGGASDWSVGTAPAAIASLYRWRVSDFFLSLPVLRLREYLFFPLFPKNCPFFAPPFCGGCGGFSPSMIASSGLRVVPINLLARYGNKSCANEI